jgi:tetratricopeptide (TPR) repeat protein
MELAEFLAARGKQEELLAELLPLQEEAGKDPAAQRRIAHLFLIAGSPSRAVEEYRALIKQNPKDADAYSGLGDAELQIGDYRAAREAFLSAAARKPHDPAIQKKVELATTLHGLDPTARKLTSNEKYRRSLEILALARDDLQNCLATNPTGASDATRQLLTSLKDTLTQKTPAAVTNELAEQVLSLAEDALHTRINLCGKAVSPGEEPLRMIMEKLAQ